MGDVFNALPDLELLHAGSEAGIPLAKSNTLMLAGAGAAK